MAVVDAITASAYVVPTDSPESDGTLEWDSTTLVLVEARAGDHTGLGYTYAHQCLVNLIGDKLAPVVEGRDALDVRAAWHAMQPGLRNLGTAGLGAMAVSAVDNALWDLKARLLDIPLAVALDAAHDAVPIYGSGGFTSYDDDQLADQLSGWVEDSIPRVKIKLGREPAKDPHRLQVSRKAIGDDVELFVDANGAFDASEAIGWAGRYAGEFGVAWFEEPVSSDDLAGLRRVRDRAPGGLEIAAGEYSWNPIDVRRMLNAEAVDCMQIDVTRCLGITGFLTAAAACDAAGVDVSAHCAPQQSLHACAAVTRLRHLEYFHDHVRIESMLFDGCVKPTNGELRPSKDRPGNGLTLKRDEAERFRVA